LAAQPATAAPVRGAPYSAEGTTTVVQTLGDGTRIERSWVTRVFRDKDGRVRREQPIAGLESLGAGDASIVMIGDPVARVTYVLDPRTRQAHRSFRASTQNVDVLPPPPPPPPGAPSARRPANLSTLPNSPETLGTRQIDGMAAVGTRRAETIPAGRIGNDRPIVVKDERWESVDLHVVVLSEHHDPRTGDVTYRLTNIRRADQPLDLFTVPSDYTIIDAPPPPPP
jgi:hypothetical protein